MIELFIASRPYTLEAKTNNIVKRKNAYTETNVELSRNIL